MTSSHTTLSPVEGVSKEGKIRTSLSVSSPSNVQIRGDLLETSVETLMERIREGGGFSNQRVYSSDAIGSVSGSPLRAERIYPHVFDENTNAGKVINHINQAKQELEKAIDAFGKPDLPSVLSSLTNISVLFNTSYPFIDFNRDLRSLVGFMKRATLVTPEEDISRSSLNALTSVIDSVIQNPMLNLNDASDMCERLSREGWKGEIEAVNILVKALLEEGTLEENQIELFP